MSRQWKPGVWKVSVLCWLVSHEFFIFFNKMFWFVFLLFHLCQRRNCRRTLGLRCICFSLSFRLGSFCNCSATTTDLAISLCKGPGMTEPCSGRGDCLECGTCVCYNPEQFEGPYCQYDRTQCQRYGGFLCNGTKKIVTDELMCVHSIGLSKCVCWCF